MIDKELLKPQLQKAIEAKFTEKFGKGEVAAIGIVNGIVPEWLRQIRTGQFSKNPEHQTWGDTYEGFCIREENRDRATEQLRGFLYGIEAAGQEEPDILTEFMKSYLEERPEEFKALCATENITKAYDILAPQGRVTLIARVPGTGKIMISIESMDEVKAVYVRENRSKKLTFKDIDDAASRLFERVPYPDSDDLGEVYSSIYGHEMKQTSPEPVKLEKVKTSKPKSKPKESTPKAPESVIKPEESVQNQAEDIMPEPKEEIATSQEDEERRVITLYTDTLRLIDKLRESFEVRKWEQALDSLESIRMKTQALKNTNVSTVDKALNTLLED